MTEVPRCDRCGGKSAWRYVKDDPDRDHPRRSLTVCSACDRKHGDALTDQGWRIDTRETAWA